MLTKYFVLLSWIRYTSKLVARCPLRHLTSNAKQLAAGLTVRGRLRPACLCQYSARRITGLQSARPYRPLSSCLLLLLLLLWTNCQLFRVHNGINETGTLPASDNAAPLRCLSATLRQVGSPRSDVAFPNRFLSLFSTRCAWCSRWVSHVGGG